MNVSEFFEQQCKAAGKTTVLTHAPNGGTLVYVSANELDPMTAILQAGLEIAARREAEGKSTTKRFEIKQHKLVVDPSHAYAWQITDENNRVAEKGFAPTEEAAKQEIAKRLGYKADES